MNEVALRKKAGSSFAIFELTATILRGGIETFAWGLARNLALRGHAVDLIGGRGNIREEVPPNCSVLTFPFIDRSCFKGVGSRLKKFLERLSFAFFAFRTLSRKRYDYICVFKPFDLPAALLAARLSSAKVIYHSGGTEFFPLYGYLLRKADFVFSCSRYNAFMIRDHCGVEPKVLYYGINLERFSVTEPDKELEKKLKSGPRCRLAISACRLIGWKGIQHAIAAIAEASKKQDIRYVVIGDGPYRGELVELARRHGVQDRVTFMGSLPNHELPAYYSIADLALFPSVADETFGISIAEAMACCVPVVATDVGGIPEVVAETGMIVSPKDEKALAGAISRLLEDDALRKSLGSSGRERVNRLFAWTNVVDRLEEETGCRTSG